MKMDNEMRFILIMIALSFCVIYLSYKNSELKTTLIKTEAHLEYVQDELGKAKHEIWILEGKD